MAPNHPVVSISPANPPAAAQEPLRYGDALARTAAETCRQHERLSRLMALGASLDELRAAYAMVDTIDLALAEAVGSYEKKCSKGPVSESPQLCSVANAMWLAAREYLRRHSIAEQASQQIRQGGDTLGNLHFEYELEASALLSLRQTTTDYLKLRPGSRC